MKKLFTLIILMTFSFYLSHATVRTVSNHPAGGSQYSSLEAAYNASSNGDTLLVEGTDIVYFLSCTGWAKSLTVIGIGFRPDKQIPMRTKIRKMDCWNEFRMHPGSSASKFYGIEFTNPVITHEGAVSNMVFEDCKFSSYFSFGGAATNFAFRNCIFDRDNEMDLGFGYAGSATGTISNCVFDGYILGYSSSTSSVTIDHCVFLGASGNFDALHYALIRNNIFMNSFPGGTFNSTYTNNICRVAGTFPATPANGNTASGNIENTNPLFVNVLVLHRTVDDYNLLAGSPAIGAAYDGTDMGVHGGFTGFSESGEVLINPIIREVSIVNTSVAPNGTLNVLIHATKPDND